MLRVAAEVLKIVSGVLGFKNDMTHRGEGAVSEMRLAPFMFLCNYIPKGETPPERSIIELPELAIYYEGFGKGVADHCLAADDNGHVVGAAWTRIMDDYGHIDDETPSLAMSVLKDHRGRGIGAHLLQELISLLSEKGYKMISLSVQKANYAVRMYDRAGFRTILENDDEYIMVCDLLNEAEIYNDGKV
jgi:ribosomal protein S18 acetylase RimI-like enzyme